MSEEQAAQFASLFYIGITAGRFLSGFVSGRIGDRRMIVIGACVLTAGIILLVIPADVPALALAGFVIIGLGCAPVYPAIIHSTPANFGTENSGAIIGIQMASAYVGSTFMPPLFGLIANRTDFAILPVYLFVFVVLMLVMTQFTFRVARKNRTAESEV